MGCISLLSLEFSIQIEFLLKRIIKLVISYVENMHLGTDKVTFTTYFLENNFKRMAVDGIQTNIFNKSSS